MNETLSKIFLSQSRLVMVGWLALLALPFWAPAKLVVLAVLAIICMVYAYVVVFGKKYEINERPSSIKGFFSLKGVMRLFANPRNTLAAWIHILAFDLTVGLFISLDALAQSISNWFVVPVLFLTLMFGPSGLFVYLIIRICHNPNLLSFGMG